MVGQLADAKIDVIAVDAVCVDGRAAKLTGPGHRVRQLV